MGKVIMLYKHSHSNFILRLFFIVLTLATVQPEESVQEIFENPFSSISYEPPELTEFRTNEIRYVIFQRALARWDRWFVEDVFFKVKINYSTRTSNLICHHI